METGKRQIRFGDVVVEFSEEDYIGYIKGLANAEVYAAQVLSDAHTSGFPDTTGSEYVQPILTGQNGLDETFDQIEDLAVRQKLYQMREIVRRLIEIDNALVVEIAWHFGLPPPKSAEDHMHLIQLMEQEIDSFKTDSRSSHSWWASEPGYRLLLEESKKLLAEVRTLKEQVDRALEI